MWEAAPFITATINNIFFCRWLQQHTSVWFLCILLLLFYLLCLRRPKERLTKIKELLLLFRCQPRQSGRLSAPINWGWRGITHRQWGLLPFSQKHGPADDGYDGSACRPLTPGEGLWDSTEDPGGLPIKLVDHLSYREEEDLVPDVPHKWPGSGWCCQDEDSWENVATSPK